MSRQSTLPSRYLVRIDSGSREGVITPSRTGEVIVGDYVYFLLTSSFPTLLPSSFPWLNRVLRLMFVTKFPSKSF